MSFPQGMEIFDGLAQFYKWFVKKNAFIMAPITKLMRKSTFFCGFQNPKKQDTIKKKYVE
jgi:hypothetical protein